VPRATHSHSAASLCDRLPHFFLQMGLILYPGSGRPVLTDGRGRQGFHLVSWSVMTFPPGAGARCATARWAAGLSEVRIANVVRSSRQLLSARVFTRAGPEAEVTSAITETSQIRRRVVLTLRAYSAYAQPPSQAHLCLARTRSPCRGAHVTRRARAGDIPLMLA
jgi:hypothetical protein